MTTVFSRILEGEIPGSFVYRDDHCACFMSINPIAPGHCLVVPRAEVDQWTDLDGPLAAHLFDVARSISRAMKVVFDCERVGLIIAGFEVPHCHLHLIPTRSMADLSFANAAPSVERAELESGAEAIRRALGPR